MTTLASRRCAPRKGPALRRPAVTRLLKQIPRWKSDPDAKSIRRTFAFANYYETMAFVNAVAWIAHAADHHPDLEVGYARCVVRYSTHDAGGLTEKDFASVLRVEAL